MASGPRCNVVNPDEVGIYHCWNCCVRQLYLLGTDVDTGKNNQHRLSWVYQIEETLAGLFAIEVGFHATLDNHLHLVLRNRPDVVRIWSDEEVARRWLKITKLKRNGLEEAEEPSETRIRLELAKPGRAATLRRRLAHVSWFMGTLSENLSRRINREDGKRGTIWQDRYQVKPLNDESSLLICGMYVDLNMIRAGKAMTPEESINTSAYDRIMAFKQELEHEKDCEPVSVRRMQMPSAGPRNATVLNNLTGEDCSDAVRRDGWLCELTLDEHQSIDAAGNISSATGQRASDKGLLRMTLQKYLELLDWTGRQIRSDKRGAIPATLAPILERLKLDVEDFIDAVIHPPHAIGGT